MDMLYDVQKESGSQKTAMMNKYIFNRIIINLW